MSWRVTPGGSGVEVEDEGPGISAAELPLVSQRFFRGQHKSASGTGLGLAIVEAAVKRLDGTLILANRPNTSGLRAVILFPEPSIRKRGCMCKQIALVYEIDASPRLLTIARPACRNVLAA